VRGEPLSAEVAAEIHPALNPGVASTSISRGSNTKIWWICELGHEYQTTPSHRSRGQGCPFCSGKRALAGWNDLATKHPDLVREWHPTRNDALEPSQVTPGSAKRAWWIDSFGHEWQSQINNRVHGTGCPICANQVVLPGYNDLLTTLPDLERWWHPTKNAMSASEVSAYSGRSAWWQCEHGHEWEATIRNRANGNGCPVCAGQLVVAELNSMAVTRPDLAAEFHPAKNGTLTPHNLFAGTGKKLWWLCSLGHEWQTTGNSRDVGGTGCPTCAGQRILIGFNDLRTAAPDVAATWHPTKNEEKTPEQVTVSNGRRFWWVCELGHEWRTTVASRTSGSGCPTCAGMVVVPGLTDLATLQPRVAAWWHPTKNGDTTPRDVAQFSNRTFWFACTYGHEWQSTVNNRSHGQGCPMCADYGFQPSKPGYVYFLQHLMHGAFKVGITNTGTRRLATFQEDGWQILHLELFQDGRHAQAVEGAVKRWWRRDLGLPMWLSQADMARTGGWTETISSDELTAIECIGKITRESLLRRDPGDRFEPRVDFDDRHRSSSIAVHPKVAPTPGSKIP
jgi:hypothetical protein